MITNSKISLHLERGRKEILYTHKYRPDAFFEWMQAASRDAQEFQTALAMIDRKLDQLRLDPSLSALTPRELRNMYLSWVKRSKTQRRRMFPNYRGVARQRLMEWLHSYLELVEGRKAFDELRRILNQLRGDSRKIAYLRGVPPLKMSKYELEKDSI